MGCSREPICSRPESEWCSRFAVEENGAEYWEEVNLPKPAMDVVATDRIDEFLDKAGPRMEAGLRREVSTGADTFSRSNAAKLDLAPRRVTQDQAETEDAQHPKSLRERENTIVYWSTSSPLT